LSVRYRIPIVDSEEQALAAIARLPRINRRTVRAAFEQRFTATTMTRAYLDVYTHMLEAPPQRTGNHHDHERGDL
jgi:hypothetical protein